MRDATTPPGSRPNWHTPAVMTRAEGRRGQAAVLALRFYAKSDQGRFKKRMKGCSLVRVRRRFWGKPRGHGCPRSFSTPPCPPTRRMRIWFATAPLPDYGWRQTMSLSTAFHKYNHVCAEGFLAQTRRERRAYPSAVCKERATTVWDKKNRRPEGCVAFRFWLRCSSVTAPLRGMLPRRASPEPKIDATNVVVFMKWST